ncbi:hypothetical protein OG230_34225 [Streptomyces sp. NBC_00234]|uniref:Rv1733c family protein n=1 Tax=Streptomyces sp. NBC_00234 TaxID=2903638 RepID=UPI002E2A8A1A|nr:hypothetical protein [Streptomyces sp. NBC_00234]
MIHHNAPGRGPTPSERPTARTALFVVTAIAVICAAVAAGMLWKAGAEADREFAAHHHRVTATTTERAVGRPLDSGYGTQPDSLASAVWEYPDNVRRSGTIDVPSRTPEGRAVTIWVDDTGGPSRAPGGTAERALASVFGGGVAAGVVGASGAAAVALVRRRSQSRGLAAWEREWEVVEPVWSGRTHRGRSPGGDEGDG